MDHLLVGPHHYRVRWKRMKKDRGLYEQAKSRVTLDPSLSESMRAETALHEVIHILFELAGADEKLEKHEEYVCRMLAPGLLQVLRDNPQLVELVLGPGYRST